MKANLTRIGINVAAIALSLAAIITVGLTNSNDRIGVLNNSRLFNEFAATKAIEIELKSLEQRHQYILDSLRLKIESDMGAEGGALDQESKEVRLYRRLTSEFERVEREERNRRSEEIWTRLNGLIIDYGNSEGFDYIFGAMGNGNMMYASEAQDVTDDALDFVNRKYLGHE